MAYAVVRTDLMHGTDVRGELVSLRFYDGDNEAAIENGNIVAIGDLLEGERELRKATAPSDDADIRTIALIATPEVMYDEHKKNLDEFINEAGTNIRGYRLHSGDIFSVTAEAITGTPAVGDSVAIGDDSTKLAIGEGFGKIIAKDVVGKYTYYVIEVA